MKITMLVGLAGNEYALSPGDTRDFPEKEAIRLIAAGYAVQTTVVAVSKKKVRANVVPSESNDAAGE